MDEPVHTQSGLPIEETPIIDPITAPMTEQPESVIPEATQIFSPSSEKQEPTPPENPPSNTRPAHNNHVGTIIFVVILFGLGVWLSMQLRSFFAPATSQEVAVPTSVPLPITTVAPLPVATSSAGVSDNTWVTSQVISGATRTAISGVSFKLPSGLPPLTCDGASCPSQGTNLPNGTRFTVAARGKGQLLPDFRGAILTDASGREFTMKQTMIGGVYGYEYVGNFTGRTGGGYTFTAMRGVLVPVNDSLSIEFNHFAPSGVTSDFAKDDVIFDKIVGSFVTNVSSPASASSSAKGF